MPFGVVVMPTSFGDFEAGMMPAGFVGSKPKLLEGLEPEELLPLVEQCWAPSLGKHSDSNFSSSTWYPATHSAQPPPVCPMTTAVPAGMASQPDPASLAAACWVTSEFLGLVSHPRALAIGPLARSARSNRAPVSGVAHKLTSGAPGSGVPPLPQAFRKHEA